MAAKTWRFCYLRQSPIHGRGGAPAETNPRIQKVRAFLNCACEFAERFKNYTDHKVETEGKFGPASCRRQQPIAGRQMTTYQDDSTTLQSSEITVGAAGVKATMTHP